MKDTQDNDTTRANVIFNCVYMFDLEMPCMLLLRASWKIDIVKWVISLKKVFIIIIIIIIIIIHKDRETMGISLERSAANATLGLNQV